MSNPFSNPVRAVVERRLMSKHAARSLPPVVKRAKAIMESAMLVSASTPGDHLYQRKTVY